MLPFFFAFATFIPVFYKITGSLVGRIPLAKTLELLRELPMPARIGLGIMFAATTAQMFLNPAGANELSFKRTFAATAVWLCTGSAAMAYAHHLRLNRATPLEPVIVGWRKAVAYAVFIVVGLAIMGAAYLRQNPR
jgi:hypothetical protein